MFVSVTEAAAGCAAGSGEGGAGEGLSVSTLGAFGRGGFGVTGTRFGTEEPLVDGHEMQVVLLAVVPVAFAAGEHRSEGVARGEQRARDRWGYLERPVAHVAEQGLRGVGDALELGEAEEPTRALDRVHHTEDALDGLLGGGVLLEGEQVLVEAIERLVALDQELLDDVVHIVAHQWFSPCDAARRFK